MTLPMGWSDAGPTSTGISGQRVDADRRQFPMRHIVPRNSGWKSFNAWGPGKRAHCQFLLKWQYARCYDFGRLKTFRVMLKSLKKSSELQPLPLIWWPKLLQRYERTVVTPILVRSLCQRRRSALTRWKRKDWKFLNGKGHCTLCHWGPYFSDGRFHNLGVNTHWSGQTYEAGLWLPMIRWQRSL